MLHLWPTVTVSVFELFHVMNVGLQAMLSKHKYLCYEKHCRTFRYAWNADVWAKQVLGSTNCMHRKGCQQQFQT